MESLSESVGMSRLFGLYHLIATNHLGSNLPCPSPLRLCQVCRRPFNDASVARYPNGVVTHIHCARDKSVCPISGRVFAKADLWQVTIAWHKCSRIDDCVTHGRNVGHPKSQRMSWHGMYWCSDDGVTHPMSRTRLEECRDLCSGNHQGCWTKNAWCDFLWSRRTFWARITSKACVNCHRILFLCENRLSEGGQPKRWRDVPRNVVVYSETSEKRRTHLDILNILEPTEICTAWYPNFPSLSAQPHRDPL